VCLDPPDPHEIAEEPFDDAATVAQDRGLGRVCVYGGDGARDVGPEVGQQEGR